MKNLLKYFRGYTLEAFTAPFFKILEACFELLVPFVVAAIIDNGIPDGDRGYILKMCGVLILLGATGLASTPRSISPQKARSDSAAICEAPFFPMSKD